MIIYVTNISPQILAGLQINYIASTSGMPTTDTVVLGPFDPITNLGTNANSSQDAYSCTSIGVPYKGSNIPVLFGQSYPVPTPHGYNIKATWSQSETSVIVVLDDEIGGSQDEQ
ncbi:MAG TPA: hypothetical protein VFO76_00575 [Candidatus Kapabacteria bacterium]|nr:hypothetical protein [Candidatus Kapabacteria bacterium]